MGRLIVKRRRMPVITLHLTEEQLDGCKDMKSFKKLYSPFWKISAQKEAFVKCLLESWGLEVKPIGVGTMSVDYVDDYGSMPDFAVLYPSDKSVLAYIEVTGGNLKILPGLNLWITVDKYLKYNPLYRNHPVYFIYLGFNQNRLSFTKYLPINIIDKYASKNIVEKIIRGRKERFIAIPFSIWRDLKELYLEFLQVLKQ